MNDRMVLKPPSKDSSRVIEHSVLTVETPHKDNPSIQHQFYRSNSLQNANASNKYQLSSQQFTEKTSGDPKTMNKGGSVITPQ